MAERAGFEPAIPVARDTGFRNRRFQPLSHLSVNNRRFLVYKAANNGRPSALRTLIRRHASWEMNDLDIAPVLTQIFGDDTTVATIRFMLAAQ